MPSLAIHPTEPMSGVADWHYDLLTPRGLYAASAGTVPPAGDFVLGALRRGSFDLLIGDVAGHGVEAAVALGWYLGALERIGWNAVDAGERDPGELLEAWNRELLRDGEPERFATCLMARFEIGTGRVLLADAGHGGALVLRPGSGPEILEAPRARPGVLAGLPLGVAAGTRYPIQELLLPAGTRVVLTTDGLWESRSTAGELYGLRGIAGFLEAQRTRTVSKLAGSLLASARGFASGRLHDDATCVVVELAQVGTGQDLRAPRVPEPGTGENLPAATILPGPVSWATRRAARHGQCHLP